MVQVSSLPIFLQQQQLPPCDFGPLMRRGGEIEDAGPSAAADDSMFVAVRKEVKECRETVEWAATNARGTKIVLLHIYQPAKFIPMPIGGSFPADKLEPAQVRAYRENQKLKINEILDDYVVICHERRVQAVKLIIEMDDIAGGIIETVASHGITKLVMGAAADRHFSKTMTEPKSKKAKIVDQQANRSCGIWFICKRNLICTREPGEDRTGIRPMASPSPCVGSSSSTPSLTTRRSSSQGQGDGQRRLRSLIQDILLRSKSDTHTLRRPSGSTTASPSTNDVPSPLIPRSPVDSAEGTIDGRDGISPSRCSTSNDGGSSTPSTSTKRDDQSFPSPTVSIDEGPIELAKAAEILHAKEMKLRKEIDQLQKQMQELENIKIQLLMKELQLARDQEPLLDAQIAGYNRTVAEVQEKLSAAEALLVTVRRERDEMVRERDAAVGIAEELRRQRNEDAAASSSQGRLDFSEFLFSELEEATNSFDLEKKIGEGGYGKVYKGILRCTPVAVKMLNPSSMQGCSEFKQEVLVLSRVRHPNLVALIGTCPEQCALVYEYLPNGSLQDRLDCKDNSPPLSWQTRTRIAFEVCSALNFLHSYTTHSIVHGDLKPANILLDSNLVSKLGDFGISRSILRENSDGTLCLNTVPKGTALYMDPELMSTGELTPKSDVYAFGIILLQLLTGKQPKGLKHEVEDALKKDRLHMILDQTAGGWPFIQAKHLAGIALECCEVDRRRRPDLENKVWKYLKRLMALVSSSSHSAPSHFICPITLGIMEDPHLAADGCSYEAEAIRKWFRNHSTSPMTNKILPHTQLTPNQALKSTIQDWLQRS